MIAFYPNLKAQIVIRGIKQRKVAETLRISEKTLSNKISGKTPFTWDEVRIIRKIFFPDADIYKLFATSDDIQNESQRNPMQIEQ